MSHKIKITGNLNVRHEILSACLERVGRCLYCDDRDAIAFTYLLLHRA